MWTGLRPTRHPYLRPRRAMQQRAHRRPSGRWRRSGLFGGLDFIHGIRDFKVDQLADAIKRAECSRTLKDLAE